MLTRGLRFCKDIRVDCGLQTKIVIFGVLIPCRRECGYQSLGGIYCHCFQGRRRWNQHAYSIRSKRYYPCARPHCVTTQQTTIRMLMDFTTTNIANIFKIRHKMTTSSETGFTVSHTSRKESFVNSIRSSKFRAWKPSFQVFTINSQRLRNQ